MGGKLPPPVAGKRGKNTVAGLRVKEYHKAKKQFEQISLNSTRRE